MLRRIRVLLAAIPIHALVLSSVASAHTDVVADAQGDVAPSAPAYVDIVQAKVTEQVGRGTLVFQLELAGRLPKTPSAFVAFNPIIDTPGGPTGDYGLVVRWCSRAMIPACGPGPAHWESALILASGPSPTLNPFPFAVNGATVKMYVDPALIGDPTEFGWRATSRLTPGSTGQPPTDLAPDTGWSAFER
jgi:hypothetical protein